MTEHLPDAPDQGQYVRRNRWRRRTVYALVFSRVFTLLAAALYVAGVSLYFINFNFGSGGDSRGAAMLLATPFLLLVAVVGDVYSVVAAWLTWRSSGSPCQAASTNADVTAATVAAGSVVAWDSGNSSLSGDVYLLLVCDTLHSAKGSIGTAGDTREHDF